MDVYNNFHSILLGFQKVDVYLISEKSKEHDFLGFFLLLDCGGLPHHFSNRSEQKSPCIFGVGWKAMPGLQSLGDWYIETRHRKSPRLGNEKLLYFQS